METTPNNTQFPEGKFAMLEGGATYHSKECICIKMMPDNFTLYVTDVPPVGFPHCKECIREANDKN